MLMAHKHSILAVCPSPSLSLAHLRLDTDTHTLYLSFTQTELLYVLSHTDSHTLAQTLYQMPFSTYNISPLYHTHTHLHAHVQTHTHACTCTNTYTHVPICFANAPFLSFSCSLTHCFPPSLSLYLTLTHSQSLKHTLS